MMTREQAHDKLIETLFDVVSELSRECRDLAFKTNCDPEAEQFLSIAGRLGKVYREVNSQIFDPII